MALGRALIYEGNETVLGTNPNRTHDQPKPYLETAETVLDLYSDKGMSPFLLHGAHEKNSLKMDALPFSNRTRNRTRTAPDENVRMVVHRIAAFQIAAMHIADSVQDRKKTMTATDVTGL